ncbi:unnamed protein product, partial [Symbiodinium microadriaticum]
MCVFGVIPRPFYQDDGSGITAVVGALQTDVTPFEKAIRIRQMALSMVQRAVAEDRIARANRTRTHQLKLGEMVPGVTRVDFHRETQGDVGWRGPAELLKINSEEGTAILSYQGRPYLVSLRHIRAHQAGVFVVLSKDQLGDLTELMHLTEKLSPYKVVTIGWVPEKKGDLTTWRRASTSSLAYAEIWPKIVRLASGLSKHNAGGAMVGQGVRQVHPPMGSCGVLLLWTYGQMEHASHEHNDDKPIILKKVTSTPVDKVCFIYVYFFVNVDYRPEQTMKVLPSEGAIDVDSECQDPGSPAASSSAASPMSISTETTTSPRSTTMPMETEEEEEVGCNKRKGPETRTVVMAPEAKKGRLELLLEHLGKDQVLTKAQHNLVNMYWAMHWCQSVPIDFPTIWYGCENNVQLAQWDIYMSRSFDQQVASLPREPFLFTWPGKKYEALFADLSNGEIYKVDDEADNITEGECYSIWPQVEEADAAEIKQFVETASFQKMHVNSLTEDTVIIDSVWVRKWKRMPDGSRKVKSRLCARGCFDKQKDLLTTRSTTATRLSQRIVLSVAANEDLEAESWDISGAFLKGLTFEKVRELLKARGVTSPVRKVVIIAPANVWRHLASFDSRFKVDYEKLSQYVLFCIKPVYGLSDAPLAWQLCLHGHFEEQGGSASLMDENLFYWRDKKTGRTTSIVTTHVDDCGEPDSFAQKLKPAEIPSTRKDEELLQANGVVKRARQEVGQGMGLYFQKLRPPLRLACVHDSSAAGNTRHYAQEGILVLLCEDHMDQFSREYEHTLTDDQCKALGGRCHILWSH